MTVNRLLISVALLSVLSAGHVSAEKTVLAGGCFWCMEADFEKLPGVVDVISGFTGGSVEDPTYSGDHTGHYEAVEITYDPEVLSYQNILDHYWTNIDPFDDTGQFCDKGPSYRAAIFVATAEQRELAQASKDAVVARFPEQTVVTPILASARFYPIKGAESYHQDFYKNNPIRYKAYRWGCGRDRRLAQIWGEKGGD